MAFNQNSGTAVPTLINSSQVLLTGNAASANALTVRQFGAGNVFSAQTTSGTTALFVAGSGNVGVGTTSPVAPLSTFFATSGIPNTTGSGTSNVATRFQTGSVCLDMGNISNGNMWLQNHLDTNWATNFPLLLNPNGGNVGVGTTNPASQLHLNGPGQATATAFSTTGNLGGSIILQDSGASAYNGGALVFGASQGYFAAIKGAIQDGTTNTKGDLYFATRNAIADTTLTTRMTITSGGNVGIGTTSPSYTLDCWTGTVQANQVRSPGGNYLTLVNGAGGSQIALQGTTTAITGGVVYMTGGNVGIGTTNPSSYTLQVSGTIGATGDITAFFSDERLKTKTGPITEALDKVCTLDTFTYTHNDLARSFGFMDKRQYVGISAQQVQKVQPEVVRIAPFDADGEGSKSGEDYITVQYERLIPLLIEAIKEERAERLKVDERLARLEKLLEQR